jgi:hypothetical protein
MTTEPTTRTIATDATVTSKLETIEETKTKSVASSEEKSASDRLLMLTPLTANPKVDAVDDYPTRKASRIKVFDEFPGLPPMTSFWRTISDQFVREHINDSNKNAKEAPHVSEHPPGLEKTFDWEDRSNRALPYANRYDGALFPDNLLGSDEYAKYSSELFIDDDEPYLDPDLVRRSRSFPCAPDDIPRFVSVPSEDSSRDSPEQVLLGGSPKTIQNGLLEVNPGEFVRVHGIKHAQDAINKGKSAVAECSVCSKRYVVDQSARALYCTACDSVTDMRTDFIGKKSALWHSER